LLAMTPRAELDGAIVPLLAGIPLVTRLGQGGMGAVYYGLHPRRREEVAVKVLSFVLAESDPAWVERFLREGQLASMLDSPFIVKVFEAGQEGGLFYFVMEYVRGISAGEFLRETQNAGAGAGAGSVGLPEQVALKICSAAVRGLIAAHDKGVIHRDIKPENIMVPRAADGSLAFESSKLADLGLARTEASGSLTATQTAMGTAGFMAPAQARDSKRVGKTADIFSMGATLHALLCGASPFTADSPFVTIMQTLEKPHKPVSASRPDVSAATQQVINRCLEKDPGARYPSAAALLSAMERCLAVSVRT